MRSLTIHQRKQREVIDAIASKIHNGNFHAGTPGQAGNPELDTRICLTSAHLPHSRLRDKVYDTFIEPLRRTEPGLYYYPSDSLHMTIKNVRVINDPPRFSEQDIQRATNIFSETIPQHTKFDVHFYRLLLFPNSLALVGTTDAEFDRLVLDLDERLTAGGVPDDKVYANTQYFFINMTLARFNTAPSPRFQQKVAEVSEALAFDAYQIDSVSLLTCNAVMKQANIRGNWRLK